MKIHKDLGFEDAIYFICMNPFRSRSKDSGSIPGWERCPGVGNGNPFSILAWKISWTEESGGLQSTGWQRVGHD